jgi:hypothetical protein
MRTGIFLSAMLATALVGSTALAERTNDSDNRTTNHAREIKDRVLAQQKEGFGHAAKSEASRSDRGANKILDQKLDHRSHGDLYENYGKSSKSAPVTRSQTSSGKMTKAPAKLSNKGGETMVDSKGKGSSRSNMGSQVGWSAGGKSIRSYVHFVNDKGQINNNIHGNTATAMKARHVAQVLLKTAGIFGKLFNWQGDGGDASESLF